MANLSAMQSAAHITQQPGPSSDLVRDYDNLFRIFYNYTPSLDAINIAEAYLQCKSLLTLADMYDALEVVGPRIDHHLLQFQSRLWKQIAKYPPSYLKLGYLARSKVIFSEALIHVVGQWPAGSRQLSHSVPDAVLDLIDDKVDDLRERKASVEAQLTRLSLLTSRGERVSPTNAYTDWLAQSLFRQWLADATSPPPPPVSKTAPPASAPTPTTHRNRNPLPAIPQPPHQAHSHQTQPQKQYTTPPSTYRLLFQSHQSYLPHEDLKKFIRLAPLPSDRDISTREALRRFERRMDELKLMAREVVRPLMRSYLELEGSGGSGSGGGNGGGGAGAGGGGGGLGYLSCTRVEEGEWPWEG